MEKESNEANKETKNENWLENEYKNLANQNKKVGGKKIGFSCGKLARDPMFCKRCN